MVGGVDAVVVLLADDVVAPGNTVGPAADCTLFVLLPVAADDPAACVVVFVGPVTTPTVPACSPALAAVEDCAGVSAGAWLVDVVLVKVSWVPRQMPDTEQLVVPSLLVHTCSPCKDTVRKPTQGGKWVEQEQPKPKILGRKELSLQQSVTEQSCLVDARQRWENKATSASLNYSTPCQIPSRTQDRVGTVNSAGIEGQIWNAHLCTCYYHPAHNRDGSVACQVCHRVGDGEGRGRKCGARRVHRPWGNSCGDLQRTSRRHKHKVKDTVTRAAADPKGWCRMLQVPSTMLPCCSVQMRTGLGLSKQIARHGSTRSVWWHVRVYGG
jgi:hypothetical protein